MMSRIFQNLRVCIHLCILLQNYKLIENYKEENSYKNYNLLFHIQNIMILNILLSCNFLLLYTSKLLFPHLGNTYNYSHNTRFFPHLDIYTKYFLQNLSQFDRKLLLVKSKKELGNNKIGFHTHLNHKLFPD